MERTDVVRFIHKPYVIERPRSAEVAQSVLYRAIYIYNKLDYSLKTLNPKLFSKKINSAIKNTFPPFDIVKTEYG